MAKITDKILRETNDKYKSQKTYGHQYCTTIFRGLKLVPPKAVDRFFKLLIERKERER